MISKSIKNQELNIKHVLTKDNLKIHNSKNK